MPRKRLIEGLTLDDFTARLVLQAIDAEVERLGEVELVASNDADPRARQLASVERLSLRTVRSSFAPAVKSWGPLRFDRAQAVAYAMVHGDPDNCRPMPARSAVHRKRREETLNALQTAAYDLVCERYGVVSPAIRDGRKRWDG